MEILSGYKNFHIFTQNQNAMYQYRAKLKRVVDGDTIDAIIDLGFKMTTEQRIRLKGINTPEIWRQKKDSQEYKRGMEAKDYVIKRFEENGNVFTIHTDKETGVYGRYIGAVFFDDSQESLNAELLRIGMATKY
jgi:micrococcal nuclease